MKKVNKEIIGARSQDLEAVVREAAYLEELETKGKTPDTILEMARKGLGLEKGQSVIAEFKDKLGGINKLQKNFIDVNGLTERLISDNLISDEEIKVLNSIEERLGTELMEVYDLNQEDLYKEE